MFSSIDYIYYTFIKKINWVLFPDYFDYSKEKAIEILKKKINFKPYPYKHYEPVFTRFYQAYLLPKKFGVDKRKLHLSNLLVSQEISRDKALQILQQPTYYSTEEEKKDLNYFLKKMNWKKKRLDEYISENEVSHMEYNSEKKLWENLKKFYYKSNILKNFFKKNTY